MTQAFEIRAADDYPLHASLYDANSDRALIVASAMGVKRRYYEPFAQFFAQNGITTLTFDYRGIGDSRPRSLRSFGRTLTEWGTLDIPAAIEWVARELKPKSLAYAGHSAGGQLAGLAHNIDRVEQLIFVCAQSGYWRYWPGMRKWALGALWVTMPKVSRAVGFFPSKLLGLGSEELPREVASEWAKWGRHPHYLFGYHDPAPYARITAPLLAWSFATDTYAPKAAVEDLLRRYRAAQIMHLHVEVGTLGHFDFFRQTKGAALWNDTLEWLCVA
ncbi:MAG TPA: alpha/beta fold hydrolase [Thermoanaerobaculia bacterium]|nr:alpha/beta fold hydrolase [Thermoanaerobaculia bacterium]